MTDSTNKKSRFVLLGGGVAGLTAADALSQLGHEVTILEAAPEFGGLCRGIPIDGSQVDLGPHILRTRDERILDYWKNDLSCDLIEKKLDADLLFMKRLIDYPVKPMQVLSALSWFALFFCGITFLWSKTRKTFIAPSKEKKSFEDWAVLNYGRGLYDVFFGPLTEKVWGVPPDSLDSDFAEQRLPPISLRAIFFGKFRKGKVHREDPRWTKRYYPSTGVWSLPQKILERIHRRNVQLVPNARVSRVSETENGCEIEFTLKGGKPTDSAQKIQCDYIFSSIPVNQLMALHENLPKMELGRLAYRGIGFLFISLSRRPKFKESMIYCADKDISFNRLSYMNDFSPEVIEPGKHVVCAEFNANDFGVETSEDFNKTIEETILSSMTNLGLFDREDICETRFELTPVVYPVYLQGYKEQLQAFFKQASLLPRLFLFGRQGLFNYYNTDQVMLSAFRAVDLNQKSSSNTELKEGFYLEGLKRS